MKELHQLVNIIPVIAKADTLTPKEIKALKQTVSAGCMLVAPVDHRLCCVEVGVVGSDCVVVVMLMECRLVLTVKTIGAGSCDYHVTVM